MRRKNKLGTTRPTNPTANKRPLIHSYHSPRKGTRRIVFFKGSQHGLEQIGERKIEKALFSNKQKKTTAPGHRKYRVEQFKEELMRSVKKINGEFAAERKVRNALEGKLRELLERELGKAELGRRIAGIEKIRSKYERRQKLESLVSLTLIKGSWGYAKAIRDGIELLAKERWKTRHFEINLKKGIFHVQVSITPKGRILVRQHPLTHGIRANEKLDLNSFDALQKILEKGKFEALVNWKDNQFRRGDANTIFHEKRRRVALAIGSQAPKEFAGDKYALELAAPASYSQGISGEYFVPDTTREKFVCVNIELAKKLSKTEIARRKAFYRKEITKKYKVPVHFVEAGK